MAEHIAGIEIPDTKLVTEATERGTCKQHVPIGKMRPLAAPERECLGPQRFSSGNEDAGVLRERRVDTQCKSDEG